MWLSWSLLIKDDGNTKKAQRLRACSFGHFPGAERIQRILTDDWGLVPVNEWSQYHCGFKLPGAWTGQRNLKWKPTDRTMFVRWCAMAGWHMQPHSLPAADSNDNSFTSGMDFITTILTGGRAIAFSSFRVVLSFSTSLGKKEKAIPLDIWSHSSVQSLIWRNQLERPQFYYRLWLSKDGTARRQAERASKKYRQWVNVTPKPVYKLRNFC